MPAFLCRPYCGGSDEDYMNRLASINFGMAIRALHRIKKAGASDDTLARAQFLEGVTGKTFNSSGTRPLPAIAQMLIEISGDPTLDVSRSPWMKSNTGQYDKVVRGIDALLRGKGVTGVEVLQDDFVLGLSSGKGNFFYRAGKHFTPDSIKKDPEAALKDMGGRVLSYARKRGIDVIRSEKSRDKHEKSWGLPVTKRTPRRPRSRRSKRSKSSHSSTPTAPLRAIIASGSTASRTID